MTVPYAHDFSLIDLVLAEQRDMTAVDRFSSFQARTPSSNSAYRNLIPLSKPKPGEQYAFVVDLDRCSGCKACVSACHSLNGLSENEMWRNVGTIVGEDSPYLQSVTSSCHHCVEPACAAGCPVLAYEKDPVTGIVRHLDDQCIGCQYCVLKCPYDVPKFSKAKGIVRKCDMCHSRLAVGESPACVQACPHDAIRVEIVNQSVVRAEGALTDARIVPGAFQSSYTLPTTRYTSERALPACAKAASTDSLRLEHAHWPLILMLVLTQTAVGLHGVALALLLAGSTSRIWEVNLAAGLFLSMGLAVSVLHLGRPLKAWRAFLGWKRSWMSREILAFSAYAATASLLLTAPKSVPLSLTTVGLGPGIRCLFGHDLRGHAPPRLVCKIRVSKFSRNYPVDGTDSCRGFVRVDFSGSRAPSCHRRHLRQDNPFRLALVHASAQPCDSPRISARARNLDDHGPLIPSLDPIFDSRDR